MPEHGVAAGLVTIDGEPLAHVFVIYHPDSHAGPIATAIEADSGNLQLNADSGAAAIVGACRITILEPRSLASGTGN